MKRSSVGGFWMLLGLAVWIGVAVTGIQTARQSAEMRGLFQQLSDNLDTQDGLLAEYRLLLLEQATVESYLHIESVAAERLDMRFPEQVRRVER